MSPTTQDSLAEKIRRYLGIQNASALRRLLARQNNAELVDMMDHILTVEEAVQCFQYLNIGQAAQVLSGLGEERQLACLSSMPALMGSQILRSMAMDDAVDILQELDVAQTQRLIEQMPLDVDTRTLQTLLLEEPDTAGGLMATEFIRVPVDGTVGDAMRAIHEADEKDFIYYCFLVDEEDHLAGVVSLKKLIFHDESVPLNRVAEFDVKSILDSTDQEFAASIFRKYYNLLAMPVVDAENHLRGIITIDDIVDVIEEETSEAVYRTAGIELEEIDEIGLMSGPILETVKARIPWLGITVVGQIFASLVIASHANTVASQVVAISFMPLLTGLSGNMGSQTNTISVRGIGQNLINAGNIKERLLREMRVALVTGSVMSVFIGSIAFMMYHRPGLALLLFAWVIVSLCFTSFLGMMIPYVAVRFFDKDPAAISAPLLTTLSDILTFSLYLSLLTSLMDYL
ncbi:MAG: magnesium transporter [Candidatus Melainabacteria bacterium]